MIIQRLPSFLQRFFSPFRPHLTKPQFAHLWGLVLAVTLNLGLAKLIRLASLAPGRHRTRRSAFLRHSDWDAPALLEQAANGLVGPMRPRPGEVLHLILDDTRIPKRGKKMGFVSKIWDHKQQKYVHGHIVLACAIAFRGVVLPWRIDLWKARGACSRSGSGIRHRKITHMAAQMIRAFTPPPGVKVRVLFDAFYLCPAVTGACRDKGFTFFSVAHRNRCFTTANGRRRKIKNLMPGLIRHHGRPVRMKRSRGTTCLRIASVQGRLSRIGRVQMVISKRPRGPWNKCIALVSNELELKPRQIVAIYEMRWLIEVLFKELRQDLGLADYQMLAEDGIIKHLHICCLAHLMLTHQSLRRLGAQARKANKKVQLPPMSQRLASLRREIARDQIRRLVKGPEHAKLRKQLYDQLLAA